MDLSTLWKMEERFWLDGPEFYANAMAPDARMVFPPPVGILAGADIVEGLRHAPRWESVDLEHRSETHAGDTAVLAYRATGRRGGADPYIALCGSTYVKVGGDWLLLAHQQTPAK